MIVKPIIILCYLCFSSIRYPRKRKVRCFSIMENVSDRRCYLGDAILKAYRQISCETCCSSTICCYSLNCISCVIDNCCAVGLSYIFLGFKNEHRTCKGFVITVAVSVVIILMSRYIPCLPLLIIVEVQYKWLCRIGNTIVRVQKPVSVFFCAENSSAEIIVYRSFGFRYLILVYIYSFAERTRCLSIVNAEQFELTE